MSTITEFKIPKRITLLVVGAIVVLLLAVTVGSFMIVGVGVGDVAIVYDPLSGSVNKEGVVGPRYFLKLPWQGVVSFKVTPVAVNMMTDPVTGAQGDYPGLPSISMDGLGLSVDITTRWSINPQKAADLFMNYPSLDWGVATIVPKIRKAVRDVISNYTAIQTVEKRAEISARITTEIEKKVEGDSSLAGAIVVEDVELRAINLDKSFLAAVAMKLKAEQLMLAAKFNQTKVQIEANASAAAMLIEADARAKSSVLLARSISESLAIIKSAGGNMTQIANDYIIMRLLQQIAESGGRVIVLVGQLGQTPIMIQPGEG